jgi:predicted nucleotidyltransferase
MGDKENLHERYTREIERVVARLREDYNPERITLFGSCARDNFDENSDIDLLIIKETKQRPLDRMREVYRVVYSPDRYLALDPLVLTSDEWAQRVKDPDYLTKEIIQEGKVLYERE